jgi:hypothetical protein
MTGPAATQQQLERYTEFLARITLEIERNLRPPEALRDFMPPTVWAQWRQAMPTGRSSLKASPGHLQARHRVAHGRCGRRVADKPAYADHADPHRRDRLP